MSTLRRRNVPTIAAEEQKAHADNVVEQIRVQLQQQIHALKADLEKQKDAVQRRLALRKSPAATDQRLNTKSTAEDELDVEIAVDSNKWKNHPILSDECTLLLSNVIVYEAVNDSTPKSESENPVDTILRAAFEELGKQIEAVEIEKDQAAVELIEQFPVQATDMQGRIDAKYRVVMAKAESLTGSNKEIILKKFKKNKEDEMKRETEALKARQKEDLESCLETYRTKRRELMRSEQVTELAAKIRFAMATSTPSSQGNAAPRHVLEPKCIWTHTNTHGSREQQQTEERALHVPLRDRRKGLGRRGGQGAGTAHAGGGPDWHSQEDRLHSGADARGQCDAVCHR